MIKENFKNSLKVSQEQLRSNEEIELENVLKHLNLFPLPKNIEAFIDIDKNILNLKLKDVNNKKHLAFQFPLDKKDLSALYKSADYEELINRYNTYTNSYISEIQNYAVNERLYLEQQFPNLVFNMKIRIKSFESYMNKLNEKIEEGKSPYIRDIMAERVILSELRNPERDLLKEKLKKEGNLVELKKLYEEDEQKLVDMCYAVAHALYDFRQDTNFRMMEIPNNKLSDDQAISKDYIKNPKKGDSSDGKSTNSNKNESSSEGYKSLHVLIQDKYDENFTYETQIRTLEMESISKSDGEIAHSKYKPRNVNDQSTTRVPMYLEVSQFKDSNGLPLIIEVPYENRFYHFYNSDKTDHSNLTEKCNPITLDKFKKEKKQIEELLGCNFQEIRARIKFNIENKSTNNIKSLE